MCDNRGNAEGLAVKRQIMSCSDLVAAEGRYHMKCQDTFSLDSNSAKSINSLYKKGRPEIIEQPENFNKLCE